MKLPTFIIIGAAKSGTTTLYEYLRRHPQVYMSTPKEPDFFAIDRVYDRGLNWYCSLFRDAQSDQVCGEASTTYTRLPIFPHAAQRIAEVLPSVKLIYILRDPIERAYSHHVHEIKCKQQQPRTTFEEGIKQRSHLVVSSDYMKHIQLYLQFFPRESLLCLLMEDLIEQPDKILKEVCDFINIDSKIDLIQDNLIAANPSMSNDEVFEGVLQRRMIAHMKKIPGLSTAATFFPAKVGYLAYQVLKVLPYYGQRFRKEYYLPPPMLSETRQMLQERFRESNQKLAKFLNRDLSHWNK